MDIDAYLDKRNWAAYDLKSKTNNNKYMVFRILFGLDVSSNEEEIEWEFTLNPVFSILSLNGYGLGGKTAPLN